MQVLVLAMVLHPDVQKRAHAEIQAVVGSERLPAYSDRPNLPYIEAVYRETLRWHPVLPFCTCFVREVTSYLTLGCHSGRPKRRGGRCLPRIQFPQR